MTTNHDTNMPPRLVRVILRAGTRYRVFEGDGMSEPCFLGRDAEVGVRLLALGPGEAGAYVANGDLVIVAYEDEVRNHRTEP